MGLSGISKGVLTTGCRRFKTLLNAASDHICLFERKVLQRIIVVAVALNLQFNSFEATCDQVFVPSFAYMLPS
jgi:hypothetical protein